MNHRLHLIIAFTVFSIGAGYADPGASLYLSKNSTPCNEVQNLTGKLNEFYSILLAGDKNSAERYYQYFDSLIISDLIEQDIILSDAMYLCGVYLYFNSRYQNAFQYFEGSAKVRATIDQRDSRYRNALTNISTSLFYMGRFGEAVNVLDSLINLVELQDGPYASDNIDNYNNLASNLNELREFDRAIVAAQKGLEIAEHINLKSNVSIIGMLYNNLGISHSRRNDYTRALIYLTRAYDLMKAAPDDNPSLFINILNSLAFYNTRLGNEDIARSYYDTAIPIAVKHPGVSSFLIIINSARFFAEDQDIARASMVLDQALEMIPVSFSPGTRPYYDMLVRAASTMSQFDIDNTRALELLREKAIPYALANSDDRLLVREIYNTYAMVLSREGFNEEALKAVQIALFGLVSEDELTEFGNPDRSNITADRSTLGLLNDKIFILRKLYEERSDTLYLRAAIETNKLLISHIEAVRIDISEEESRILLGDNYRRAYDGIVKDLHNLWSLSGSDRDMRLAFEYAERSKAAGLLVSLREIRASQFLIPDSLSVLERNLEVELGAVREFIANELLSENPDSNRLEELRNSEFAAAQRKSELIRLFESSYPDYYSAKYNTKVAGLDEVRKMMGKKDTYINYVLADTSIYIFVVNRKHTAFIRQSTDAEFFQSLTDFRNVIMKPASIIRARQVFNEINQNGHYLYEKLISPVRELLTTRRLIISPDNLLAYIPFEALLTTLQSRDDILYRELDFMVKEFEISYTYSATMYIETSGGGRSLNNRALAFAPEYTGNMERDSVLNTRQLRQEVLSDLPHARDEASYVQRRLGGELYLNENALESIYKSRASQFPVIHLAMHAIINNQYPAYSKLIFSKENNNEGFLNTYEIYGVPLSSKMVVVSSCNTGSGKLTAGEGVMSLARGFITAGSQSVIMSLWEVDDELGFEIMRFFYENLKRGDSKSKSLRKAKLEMLNGSSQYQSHPFYWSTLVLYGNRSPLFFDAGMLLSAVLLMLALIASAIRLVFYLRSK